MSHRYVELDLLRTLAIAMMVTYHGAYDLSQFYGWNIHVFEGGWRLLWQSTVTLFLLLVGCSFAISWNRHGEKHGDASFRFRYRKYLLRGIGVIACGMLVSAVTFMIDPETYVRFGILHVIGVSILLLPFFAFLKEGNVLIGMLVISLMKIIPDATTDTSLLLPIGIMPSGFASVDYIPLIPWFGVVLIGYAIGEALYVRRKTGALFTFNFPLFTALVLPGRNALLIYLLHQPILLGILGIFGFFGIL
ncbi:MAG: DUF1624 domain-containing protein [Candidatus Peribacteraceae bacterium]|nr:DUF1624 domain-containing protein [Candidatus Peribacteraceae bacterium]